MERRIRECSLDMANLLIGAAIGAINSKATAAAAMRSGVTVLNIVLPLAASVLTGLATGIVAFSSFVRERRLKEIKMLSDDVDAQRKGGFPPYATGWNDRDHKYFPRWRKNMSPLLQSSPPPAQFLMLQLSPSGVASATTVASFLLLILVVLAISAVAIVHRGRISAWLSRLNYSTATENEKDRRNAIVCSPKMTSGSTVEAVAMAEHVALLRQELVDIREGSMSRDAENAARIARLNAELSQTREGSIAREVEIGRLRAQVSDLRCQTASRSQIQQQNAVSTSLERAGRQLHKDQRQFAVSSMSSLPRLHSTRDLDQSVPPVQKRTLPRLSPFRPGTIPPKEWLVQQEDVAWRYRRSIDDESEDGACAEGEIDEMNCNNSIDSKWEDSCYYHTPATASPVYEHKHIEFRPGDEHNGFDEPRLENDESRNCPLKRGHAAAGSTIVNPEMKIFTPPPKWPSSEVTYNANGLFTPQGKKEHPTAKDAISFILSFKPTKTPPILPPRNGKTSSESHRAPRQAGKYTPAMRHRGGA